MKRWMMGGLCAVALCVCGCQAEVGEAKGLKRPSDGGGVVEQNGPHFEKANAALLDGMPRHAIEICKQGIEAGESACYRIVGIAYKQQGEYEQACDYFSRASQRGPSLAHDRALREAPQMCLSEARRDVRRQGSSRERIR